MNAWTADLLDGGAEAATARARQLAVRRFSAWLHAEGESERDDLLGIKPPKLDTKITQQLSEQQCRDLIAACRGKTFRDRRDEAIIRLALGTGARAGELIGLTTADVDLTGGSAIVRRGKGGRGRMVPFGPSTARAVDRYARLRRTHRLASTPALWLGERGKPFNYDGLREMVRRRGGLAGIDGLRPHTLRHTFAGRWLAAGGTENALMAVAGSRTATSAASHQPAQPKSRRSTSPQGVKTQMPEKGQDSAHVAVDRM